MILSQRALNRSTLHRQLLLGRARLPVATAVHRIAGLNGQDREPPALMLAARLHKVDLPLLRDRSLVRAPLMRGTQHIVTADDYLTWRPILQPVLSRVQRVFRRETPGLDPHDLATEAAAILANGPMTRSQLARALAKIWPNHDPKAMAMSVQMLLPIVHPPSGAKTTLALAEPLLGRPIPPSTDPQPLIERYLAAFGPASIKDVQAWSGLTRLREVVEQMELRFFEDEFGGMLYDLPDAPLPDPDTPAPIRFLPYADNLLLAHADRRRIMDPSVQKRVCIGAVIKPTILVDGRVAGTWSMIRGGSLSIELFIKKKVDLDREAQKLREWVTKGEKQ